MATSEARARVTIARARAERLPQAVLREAFAGRLAPQDPSDEPAGVLLARIRAERAAAGPAKRGRKGGRQQALPLDG